VVTSHNLEYTSPVLVSRFENLQDFFNVHVLAYSLENHADSKGFLYRCVPLIEKYGDKKLLDIDPDLISQLLNDLSGDLKDVTKARYLKAWNKCFNIAKKLSLIEINPCKSVSKPTSIQSGVRILSLAEVDALIEGASAYESCIHPSAILFCLFTGVPLERVRSLEWSWFSDDYSRLKSSGLSERQSIEINLNVVAQAIVKRALNYGGATYIFPALDRGGRAESTHMSKPKRCVNYLRDHIHDETAVSGSFDSFDLRKTYNHRFSNADNDLLSRYLKFVFK
jgi:integrase